jgi:hypothetical protein
MKTAVISTAWLLAGSLSVLAQPADVWQFRDCFSGNETQKLNVSTVYAQILDADKENRHLNITLIGSSGQDILGQSGSNLCE